MKRRVRGKSRFIEAVAPSKRAEVYYRAQIDHLIQSMLDQILDSVRKPRLNDTEEVGDDDSAARLLAALTALSNKDITQSATRVAMGFIGRSNTQNKERFTRSMQRARGIDIASIVNEMNLGDTMAKAIKDNIDLIKSIKTDFINDIGAQVFEDFKKGKRQSDLIADIYERGNVTKSRAKLIARDQTAKVNSAFNEARNRKLGFDVYKWSGGNDERQRQSHRVLNGMLCKYSDPTVYSDDNGKTWKKRSSIGAYIGNPGTDYQCRCLDQPQIDF